MPEENLKGGPEHVRGKGRVETRAPSNGHKGFVDLSHTVEHDLLTYQGLPCPVISDYMSREASRAHYASGTEFHIGKIEMVGNTGTYLDSPFHRYADGKDLSELPLASLADLPGVLIDGNPRPANGVDLFGGKDLSGKAVLVRTNWSQYWRTNRYFENPPFLTKEAAELLMESGAALVGIDSLNIDDIHDRSRPVHSILLQAGIPIVEHLTNLGDVHSDNFRFFAVPVKVRSFGTFPVRAFAITL
jgi:arylformamidase